MMRPLTWLRPCILLVLLGSTLAGPMAAQSHSQPQIASGAQSYPVDWIQQFVPDSPAFWDNSANWTSNYGPAYRDTLQSPSQMLACSPQFALCFHSGPEPYPCHLSPDGRSANCKCMVLTKTNYALLTAILNYPVYLDTIALCGADGSLCAGVVGIIAWMLGLGPWQIAVAMLIAFLIVLAWGFGVMVKTAV